MIDVQQMKQELATKKRRQLKLALGALEGMEHLSHSMTDCVWDSNGEPGNGWTPNLERAHLLINLVYCHTVRVRALLECRDNDVTGSEIEIALYCERSGLAYTLDR
jgi:hypothetical protein